MTVDYAKRTIQRQKDRHSGRPKAVESRGDRIVRQGNILADHAALLHMVLLDARSVVSSPNLFTWFKYLEDRSAGLLRLELTPAEGLQRKYDQERDSQIYKNMRSAISFKIAQQYQEDKLL